MLQNYYRNEKPTITKNGDFVVTETIKEVSNRFFHDLNRRVRLYQ